MGISWPTEDVEKLEALWPQGLSASIIAMRFAGKYTRSGICGKAARLGLPPRTTTTRTPPTRNKTVCHPNFSPLRPFIDGIMAKDLSHLDNEPKPIGPKSRFPDGPGCRWIAGDARTKDWQCCGHEVSSPSPYCSHHRARAWTKPHNLNIRGAR